MILGVEVVVLVASGSASSAAAVLGPAVPPVLGAADARVRIGEGLVAFFLSMWLLRLDTVDAGPDTEVQACAGAVAVAVVVVDVVVIAGVGVLAVVVVVEAALAAAELPLSSWLSLFTLVC